MQKREGNIDVGYLSTVAEIDECSVTKNGGCSHKCVNTVRGYKCECPDPELKLSPDNKTCHGKRIYKK